MPKKHLTRHFRHDEPQTQQRWQHSGDYDLDELFAWMTAIGR